MRRAALLSFVLAVTLASAAARADGRAEQLFVDGRAAMKNGDYARALGLIQQSYALEAAPGTLLNLAECESHVGKLLEAIDHFKQTAAQLPAGDRRRAVAEERIAAIGPRVPKLTIALAAGAPAGTAVKRGDARVDVGTPVLVDPGAFELTVAAPGRPAKVVSVELREGDAKTLTLEPGEAGEGGSTTEATPAAEPGAGGRVTTVVKEKRTAGFIVGGVGIASLGVGVVTGVMALSKASTVKDHCDASLACDPEGVSAGSSGKTLSLVSTITIAAGLLGVGVGTYLVLTSKKSAPTTAVLPVFGRDGGGVALVRRF